MSDLVAELRPRLSEEDRTDERVERWLLEAATIRLYNERRIGHGGVGRMLGFGWAETEAFLVANKVPSNWDDEEVAREIAAVEGMRRQSAA